MTTKVFQFLVGLFIVYRVYRIYWKTLWITEDRYDFFTINYIYRSGFFAAKI